ncbi:MAG: molybdopterin cofactor-binding domain-containing protein [Rhodospirillaceae bacterium]
MTRMDTTALPVSRRGFLGGAAGLTFAVTVGGGLKLLPSAEAATGLRDVGAWVRIAPDNSITIVTPAAEMGQGSMTGVPTALAEELDADWDRVTLEMAPAEPETYGYPSWGGAKRMGIYGSLAVRSYYMPVRLAGAQARRVLLDNAARKWGVPVGELITEPSVVVHPPSGRRLTYGEIAAFAEVPATMPEVTAADLKKPADFRIIGKPVPRRDVPEKVDGSAKYSMDVHLPGMVYASTVHAPVQMAKPSGWNDAEVRKLPGVVDVVKLPRGVAVVAKTFEQVLATRRTLEVTWAKGAAAEGFNSEDALVDIYAKMAKTGDGSSVTAKGDVAAAFAGAAKTFKADYRSDFAYHAQMEPLNGVAWFNAADQLEVWEGTQAPGSSRTAIAGALGLRVDQVIHHQMYMGGGFGRRSITDYTIEAALVSRAVGKPVKMIWTREEDVAFGMFRPQTLQCLEAALDKDGKIAGWKHCVVGDGGGLITSGIKLDLYYGIANQAVELRGASHGIRLKHWRAVAHPFNLFAIESLVDEMATAEGMDPLAFRRERMNMTAKAADVFDRVAAMSDWGAKRPDGRALGLAVSERSGSLAAGVVEISLDRRSGRIRVHKVWMAVDGGTVVQPEMARHNIESGIIWGLSGALKERASMTGGAVDQSNFHDYEVLRMAEAPEEMHVEFLARDSKPAGLGEIGNPFAAAAIANAFFELTGKRLYHMPFTPERVLAALKA